MPDWRYLVVSSFDFSHLAVDVLTCFDFENWRRKVKFCGIILSVLLEIHVTPLFRTCVQSAERTCEWKSPS